MNNFLEYLCVTCVLLSLIFVVYPYVNRRLRRKMSESDSDSNAENVPLHITTDFCDFHYSSRRNYVTASYLNQLRYEKWMIGVRFCLVEGLITKIDSNPGDEMIDVFVVTSGETWSQIQQDSMN